MAGHPFDEFFARLVQHHQVRTAPLVLGKVVAQAADGSLDLELAPELGLGPGPQGVPLAMAPGMAAVKVAMGAIALLEFIDLGNGRSSPVVRHFVSHQAVEVTLQASASVKIQAPAVDVGNTGAAVKLAGGTRPLVRVSDKAVVGLVAGPTPVTGVFATEAPGTVLA